MKTNWKKSTSYAAATLLFGFCQISFGATEDAACQLLGRCQKSIGTQKNIDAQKNAYQDSFEGCKQNKACYCSNLGSVYETAATERDNGESPEQVFMVVSTYKQIISDKVIKKAINQVFFDSGFFYAGGHALQMQMMNICLGNVKTFKPLK